MQPAENPFMLIGTGEQEDTGTRMESVEEIRAALQARRKPTEKEPVEDTDTLDFRPVRRPSMAMLCLLDDGRQIIREEDSGVKPNMLVIMTELTSKNLRQRLKECEKLGLTGILSLEKNAIIRKPPTTTTSRMTTTPSSQPGRSCSTVKTTNAETSISLSAKGSRKAPISVRALNQRATVPSRASVSAAATKT